MRRMLLGIGLLVGACGPTPTEESSAHLVRLSERFASEQIVGSANLRPVEPSEWRFEALADGWSWQASVGVEDTDVVDGSLHGTITDPRSVVELTAPGPLGDGDRLFAIEVRVKVSEGDTLELTVLGGEGPPAPAFADEEGPPLSLSTPLTSGDEVQTYRIDLERAVTLGPFAERDPTRVVLRPSTERGAEFALESVRLIFRDEHYASLESGLGWHGLGDVWREALASRPGEELVIPLSVPRHRPVLDLFVGTPVDHPVTFRIEALDPAGRVTPLALRTVTQRDRWEKERIDLTFLAGSSIDLRLRVESEEPAQVGLWGSGILASRGVGPAAPGSGRPQGVILVVADTLRRDHLDAWGYGRETAPTLTRLAAEGVRFEDAVSQAVWTKVSVPSILTGLYPATHGIVEIPDRLPSTATTLAEAFRGAGYTTMGTSSWSFTGQLTNLHQGFDVLWEGGSVDLPDEHRTKSARFFVDRALEYVEDHRDLPFLIVLHVGDPHSPYEPLGAYSELFTEPGASKRHAELAERLIPEIESPFYRMMELPQPGDLERGGVELEWWRDHEIDWYDGSVRALDAEVLRLVDRLEHLGLTDRVVFGFVADHGEEFFEHGHNWHGANLYGYQTDVPLILWGPGFVPSGVEVASTVQTIDLYPTLLDLAGIELPEITQGRSLQPAIDALAAGESIERRGFRPAPAFVQHILDDAAPGVPDSMQLGEAYSLVEGRWRLIHNAKRGADIPEYELYDRIADPSSLQDLSSEHPEVVESLAARLAEWRSWVAEHELPAEAAGDLSAEELERLRSLGYL